MILVDNPFKSKGSYSYRVVQFLKGTRRVEITLPAIFLGIHWRKVLCAASRKVIVEALLIVILSGKRADTYRHKEMRSTMRPSRPVLAPMAPICHSAGTCPADPLSRSLSS
jgi:hypothetical protein